MSRPAVKSVTAVTIPAVSFPCRTNGVWLFDEGNQPAGGPR